MSNTEFIKRYNNYREDPTVLADVGQRLLDVWASYHKDEDEDYEDVSISGSDLTARIAEIIHEELDLYNA